MGQIISCGTTSDGYEYFAEYDNESSIPKRQFRMDLKTGIIEDLSDNSN